MMLTEQLKTEFEQYLFLKKHYSSICFYLFLFFASLLLLYKIEIPILSPYLKEQAVLICLFLTFLIWYLLKLKSCVERLEVIEIAIASFKKIKATTSLHSFNEYDAELITLAKHDKWVCQFLACNRTELNAHFRQVNKLNQIKSLENCVVKNSHAIPLKTKQLRTQIPLVQVKITVDTALDNLVKRRTELQTQWAEAYAGFSWWNKLKYPEHLPLQELNKTIDRLNFLQNKLLTDHHDDFVAIEQRISLYKKNAHRRIRELSQQAKRYLMSAENTVFSSQQLLERAFWFSALSLPISIWNDASQASNVYGALRSVNSQYEGLTDSEIWWQTLFLPSEQLAGLAALTKGVYFEQLVAAEFQGDLHAHFNHADTDIVIDGIAYQIKATDSAAYIDSVEEGVPVIATTEIAESMQLIDGGFSNAELNNTIDLAIGGSVVDLPDTTSDAILAGLGGLGFFATLHGINHAAEKIQNGGDAAEALFEGAGVAIERSAMALVGLAEMTYNALNSRPSRFVGRLIVKGATGIGNRLSK